MAPMALHVRRATADDLDAVAVLTRRNRHQLAAWEPDFWRMAEGADQLHALWLAHLLTSSDAVARVVVDDGEVAACAICVRQPAQWFADDLATATDERWADAGRLLLEHIGERPVLTCVPHRDGARATAVRDAGWAHVSDYRTLRLDRARHDGPQPAETTPPPGALPPPAHTFGPVDPTVPVPAPPVYDPGGTSCIADRVVGPDRGRLLDRMATAAVAAGATQLIVVCAAGDDELRDALDERGAGHPVQVHQAPTA
jgi:hypothetical protein